jgi:hypothetical protein
MVSWEARLSSQFTPVEQFWLEWHARQGEADAAALARKLLEGGTTAAETGTPGRVRRQPALRAFAAPAASALPCTRHGEQVASVAAALFDATRIVHRQPATARALLLLAARLHDLTEGGNHRGAPSAADVLAGVRLADLSRSRQAVLVAALRRAQSGATKPYHQAEAGLKPEQRRQARALAAILQLADALDQAKDQSTRVEEVTLADDGVVVRLGGLAAAEATRWGKLQATLWQPAFKTRLRFSVAPLTGAEVAGLAAAPADRRLTLAGGIQRALARRLVCWQAALEAAASQPSPEMTPALQATTELRQALAALQPVLKRKPTQALRAALRGPEALLRKAVEWQYLWQRIAGAQAEARRETAGQLQPLADAAAHSRQQAAGMALAWVQGPGALELAEALVDFVSTVPGGRKHTAPLWQAAQDGLGEAAKRLAQAQAKYSAQDPKSWRNAQRAAQRCRTWLALLGSGDPGRAMTDEAALAADLDKLVGQLEAQRWIEAADGHLGAFLERWAVRQARRKAPQLHGAEAVLALRQAVRRAREQQQRGVAADWRPVRGRQLRQRVQQVTRSAAEAEKQA